MSFPILILAALEACSVKGDSGLVFALRSRKEENFLKPEGFRQDLFSLMLVTLAINILSLALPVMTLQVYDRILPNSGTGTFPVLIIGVCVAIALEAFLRLLRAYALSRAGAAYEHGMACAAMGKILNADLSQMKHYGIGERLHHLGSVSKLKDFNNGYAATVLAEAVFVPLYFCLIVYISKTLSIIPAALLAVFVTLSLYNGARLRRTLRNREEADGQRFNFLIEALEGIHTVKAFALEKIFERRYERLEEQSTLENYRVTQETAGTFNTGAVFSHLMVASVITAGAWFVLNGMLTTGGLIATLLLSGRIMQPVQKALALWARYQDYLLARRHIEEIFSTPQKIVVAGVTKETDFAGRLNLSRVSFRYCPGDDFILKDVNLDLQMGDSVFVSGAHGTGKTTLLNLIAGIYPPSEGDINIDGVHIDRYAPEDLVRHVGFIRTQALIFRGTVRDNITCFGQADEAQAKEVAALLEVDVDVAKLPGGFDTFLNGNNTDSISPGLKQRIAMVRVLANKPRLILFDNADRTLDRNGYALVYSLLARLKGKASLVLVTDDRNISALADRHYMLENGVLTAIEAMHSKGNIHPYRELPL